MVPLAKPSACFERFCLFSLLLLCFPRFRLQRYNFFQCFANILRKKSIYSELFGANPLILNSIRYLLVSMSSRKQTERECVVQSRSANIYII